MLYLEFSPLSIWRNFICECSFEQWLDRCLCYRWNLQKVFLSIYELKQTEKFAYMWGAPTRFPPVFFFHNKQTLCKCVWKRVVFLWCPYLELLLLPVGGIGAFSTQECGCFPLLKFKGKSYHVFWLGLIRQCFSLKKFSDYAVFNDTTPHVYWMYVLYCIKCQVHSKIYIIKR